jgi:DNA-3-methyladenine glycosylase
VAGRFDRAALERPAVDVAPALLGAVVAVRDGDAVTRVRIVETEAYEPEDPASHAFGGRTQRNGSMFERAGTLYVYRVYGVHRCANVVTGAPGVGSAVLLRAAEALGDVPRLMQARRADVARRDLCRGPGRLTVALGLGDADDGEDLISGDRVWLEPGERPAGIVASPRIGISRATELAWRFTIEGSRSISSPRPPMDRPAPRS